MSYEDAGFDQYLLRSLEATYTEQAGVDSSSAFDQISGSQVKGDKIVSLTGSLELDLQGDKYLVKDGDINRVEFGRLFDGTIGLIIRDTQGNELMKISGERNIIKSANGNIELDFDNERILIRDISGTPRVLIGKGDF